MAPQLHSQYKRAVAAPGAPLVAGIIVGLVTLNVLLLISWWIVKRRRLRAQRNALLSEKVTDSSTSSFATKQKLSSTAGSKRVPPPRAPVEQTPNYMQLMMALQTDGRKTRNRSNSETSRNGRSAKLRKPEVPMVERKGESSRKRSLDAQPAPARPPPVHQRVSSIQRPRSMDTASIYSSASAPTEAHDHIFQRLALDDPPASAPAWSSTHIFGTDGASRRESRPTPPELTPEFYMRGGSYEPQPAPLSAIHARSSSRDIPPVPSLPFLSRPPQIIPRKESIPTLAEHTARPRAPSLTGAREPVPPSPTSTVSSYGTPTYHTPPGISVPPTSEIPPPNIRRSVLLSRTSDEQVVSAGPTTPAVTITAAPPDLPVRSPLRSRP
ncbi:hypothetical protein PLICRDRAFT_696178 [Plicaturopsis crispa FD-325 SS-3]|nr:hypothetical protein PLICRDRAFT_696178 [Plicaturopsis crispa FD-325 SS-3]